MKIEGEIDQVIGFPVRQGSLKTGKIGRAAVVESDDFSIDDAIRQLAGGPRDSAKFGRPVEPLPGLQVSPHRSQPASECGIHQI